jgi:hypothetical protein
MPHAREAANLSWIRSPITSRSNWAKLSRMFSVSRPMDVVVLNACVTLTKVTPKANAQISDDECPADRERLRNRTVKQLASNPVLSGPCSSLVLPVVP